MAKKKDHTTFRNGALFCTHCGQSQVIAFPMEIPVFSAMTKAFAKSHRNCIKTWEQEMPNPDWPIHERITFWWYKGEHGTSSEVMWNTLTENMLHTLGGAKYPFSQHPCDSDDFRRCHMLLKMVPEWKEKLPLLNDLSPVWANLVQHWDELTRMLEEQMETGKTNGMYAFMKTLGC